jgi:outer membrane lipoprotein-sorting protein
MAATRKIERPRDLDMMVQTKLVRTLVLAGAAVLAAAPARAQELPAARQIVDAYVNAIGGTQAISQAQHRHMVGEMSMPAAGMTLSMEIWQARPNKMVMVMDVPGMGEIKQGYDGTTAWSVNPMQGPRILDGAELEQSVRQADFDANLRFEHLFPTMETVERTEMAGRPCYRVRMVAANGDEAFGCFDTETKLLLGLTSRTESEMGVMESTSMFHDYRDFSGVKMPTRTTVSVMGQEMVMTIKEMDTNPVPASQFALPAEIQALKQ